MATNPITLQELIDAATDAETLEAVANGEPGVITTRLGRQIKTVSKVIGDMDATTTTAIVARDQAVIAKNAAEAARDAALIQSGVYVDVATGLAAVADGVYFKVQGSGDVAAYEYKRVNSTTATLIAAYPSATGIDNRFKNLQIFTDEMTLIKDSKGRTLGFAITDESGKAAIIIRSDGTVRLAGIELLTGDVLKIGELQQETGTADDGTVWAIADDKDEIAVSVTKDGHVRIGAAQHEALASGVAWAITDELGRAALIVERDGTVRAPLLVLPEEPETPPTPVVDSLKSMANHKTDYMHFFSYGQSLSRGATANPPVSTAQAYQNVTFLSGVLPRGTDAIDYSGFKPLVEEKAYSSSTEAETPTSGIVNRLTELGIAAGDTAADWVFVGTAPGRGGQPIQNLNRGTAYWSYMMEQVSAAQALANAAGKSYSVWGMAWTQGENNYSLNNTVQEYYDLFVQMKEDFAADVSLITKQDFKPPIVCYQVAAHRRYGKDHCNIAIAQWLASRADPDIIMACSMYALPYNTDNLHLTADSSKQLGRYYARAFHEAVILGKGDWRPLEPTSVIWQGRVIDIAFHVPHGQLIFDTTLVTEAPNKGFDIWSQGSPILDIVGTVSIVGKNRVRITLAYDPPSDALLTYARGRPGDPATAGPIDGPRGNIRDQHGDIDNYQDSTGTTRYMHNWAVIFQYQINQGAI